MKQIGAEIGVNESRVSQLHARAVQRLQQGARRGVRGGGSGQALRPAILAFQQTMRRMQHGEGGWARGAGVVLPYKVPAKPMVKTRAARTRRAAAGQPQGTLTVSRASRWRLSEDP